MEVAGEDGSKLVIGEAVTIFGRGSGFASKDRTVSRRHLLIETKTLGNSNEAPTEHGVSFEVIGRNPFWVRSGKYDEIRTFRRSEKGEMAPGDSFCVGGQQPTWFKLNKIPKFEEGKQIGQRSENELAERLARSSNSEDIDVSGTDPIKEFGFLVVGHEFDCYGNRVIRDTKKWDWFLDEPRKDSDDDEDYGRKKRRGARGKRKKGANSDDEDWTDKSDDDVQIIAETKMVQRPKYSTRSDESEDDVQIIAETKKVERPKYSTRSNNRNKTHKADTGGSRTQKAAYPNKHFDEDDETLGGFIVDDEGDSGEQMDEDEDEDDEEEEDFSDDDEE